jgi:hypothetical protein
LGEGVRCPSSHGYGSGYEKLPLVEIRGLIVVMVTGYYLSKVKKKGFDNEIGTHHHSLYHYRYISLQ